ncbi:unnamed protein product [Schistosoma intercalatum]|nr:unnamed protein product [Schistosoma intercalatum]CAH8623574.1 unnamed protein product [Schistosoma intercalatum]CAH8623634.1 unnamed protein product [Schistosoma intercalatum]
MSSHVIREGHVCSYDRAVTTNDTVSYQRCELNSSSTNEILNQETMNREKQEVVGSPDVTQDAFKAELRKDNEILLSSNDHNNIELNLAEDETYDSDDSNAYVRRRVAELNLELSKEKEYFADNYEKKTGRVNFHPQLFYSRIISQNSCEDLNDFSEDEINELKNVSHNEDDTMNKSIMNANPRYSQQRTSDIPGPVNISENNLGGYESLISKENNVEEADKNLNDNTNVTDEVTRTKKYRKTPINERDNNITKIITMRVSDQKTERTCNSQFQNNNDKPLTEKSKENSIQIADKKSRDQKLSNWLRAKVLQRKSEGEMRRYENEEQQHLNVVHSREACEQAFKQWLKRKNREAKEQKRRAKERMKITRQLVRGNHDWQQFMKNIRKFDVLKILL